MIFTGFDITAIDTSDYWLIGCEVSGIVREEMRRRGIKAISVDLLPSDQPGPHVQGDIIEFLELYARWRGAIFFPPCTYVCGSGLHWNKRRPERAALTEEAIAFFVKLYNSPLISRVALENPIGCLSTRFRKPDQIIQPWQFGDDASKATCIWTRNLPKLVPTNVLPGDRLTRRANQTASGQNKLGPSPDRWKLRSLTYPGIAAAMVDQWAI